MPGNTRTAGVPPRRWQPLMRCPVTGLLFHYFDGKYRNGSLVHPMAYDRLGYREMPVSSTNPEVAYKPTRPRWFPWGQR